MLIFSLVRRSFALCLYGRHAHRFHDLRRFATCMRCRSASPDRSAQPTTAPQSWSASSIKHGARVAMSALAGRACAALTRGTPPALADDAVDLQGLRLALDLRRRQLFDVEVVLHRFVGVLA